MAKIKIALLCNGYGWVKRGAERFTEELYNHLKNTFDIDIYGIKVTNHSFGTNTKTRYDFKIPWRNGRAYLESYYFGKEWYNSFLYKKHYDIILNNAGLGGSYWCRKYRAKTGIPFITFERGGGKEEIINYLFKPNCMVFLTKKNQKAICKRYLPKVNTTVLPIGIELDEYTKHQPTSKLMEGLERPIFLSTSAMVKFKRIDLIIKAVNRLGKGSLIQTSKGNMRDGITRLGKKLLGEKFRYVGVVDREKLLGLYQSCDAFVNASRKEAFGVVYLEAMASRLPIVTQKDERRIEIVGNAGLFVDCEDIGKFALTLDRAAKLKYNNLSLERAKKFSWKTLKPKYKELIEEVAS